MDQVFFGGYFSGPSTSVVNYNTMSGGRIWDTAANIGQVQDLMPTAGAWAKLRVVLTVAPGAGKSYKFTLFVDGVASALTTTISNTDTSNADTVNSVAVTAGQTVTIECLPTGSPAATVVTWTWVFTGDIAGESIIMGHNLNNFANNVNRFCVMAMSESLATTPIPVEQLVAASGIIKKLFIELKGFSPGTDPDAYRFTVQKNTVSQPLTVTITGTGTSGDDTVNSFTIVGGDTLDMLIEPISVPANVGRARWGCVFVADTDGESLLLGALTADLDNSLTEFGAIPTRPALFWTVTEADRRMLGQVCTLKKLFIKLTATPGAGNNYKFTTRVAGVDGNLTVTVADAATTGNDSVNTDVIANDQHIAVQVIPTSVPNVADALYGMVCFVAPSGPPAPLPVTLGHTSVHRRQAWFRG